MGFAENISGGSPGERFIVPDNEPRAHADVSGGDSNAKDRSLFLASRGREPGTPNGVQRTGRPEQQTSVPPELPFELLCGNHEKRKQI